MNDIYILKTLEELKYTLDKLQSEEDNLERDKILTQFDELFPMLRKNPQTRRCVATFMTESEGQLTYACPTLIHVFIEDNKVCVKSYFRSLNLKKNFEFDKNTLRRLLINACMTLDKKPGYIKIFIGCPHEC